MRSDGDERLPTPHFHPEGPMNELDITAATAWLVDRAQITEVLIQYAWGADLKDWEMMRDCLTEDVDLVFPGHRHHGTFGYIEHMAGFAGDLYDGAQHALSNFHIVIDGDHADSRVSVAAARRIAGEWTIRYGWYEIELVRTEEGWRIHTLVLKLV